MVRASPAAARAAAWPSPTQRNQTQPNPRSNPTRALLPQVSEESLRSGRLHTLCTAAFSHRDAWHLGGNMLTLWFFGREIGQIFGGHYLLHLYLVGGAVASLSHVAYCWRACPPVRPASPPLPGLKPSPLAGAAGTSAAVRLGAATLAAPFSGRPRRWEPPALSTPSSCCPAASSPGASCAPARPPAAPPRRAW